MSTRELRLNRIRYGLYAPIYDFFVKKVFAQHRKTSIDSLNLKGDEKILILGAGTGLDLEFLQGKNFEIHAIDISPAMIKRLKGKANKLDVNCHSSVMDGQDLKYEDQSFDIVLAHLIIAVVPDPLKCIREIERVLKKDGRLAVFDKFIPASGKASLLRRIVNLPVKFLFTDLTRDIDKIILNTGFKKVKDVPVAFGGNFRRIILNL